MGPYLVRETATRITFAHAGVLGQYLTREIATTINLAHAGVSGHMRMSVGETYLAAYCSHLDSLRGTAMDVFTPESIYDKGFHPCTDDSGMYIVYRGIPWLMVEVEYLFFTA